MKPNLKDFPNQHEIASPLIHSEAAQRWKEEFEKKLREIRNSARNLALKEDSDVVPDLIREILGEEE